MTREQIQSVDRIRKNAEFTKYNVSYKGAREYEITAREDRATLLMIVGYLENQLSDANLIGNKAVTGLIESELKVKEQAAEIEKLKKEIENMNTGKDW